jgi:hypothetical protein
MDFQEKKSPAHHAAKYTEHIIEEYAQIVKNAQSAVTVEIQDL